MAPKRVTLTKDGRDISLALPQDIVEYKANGWREKPAARAVPPVAPSGGAPKPVDSVKEGVKK